MTTAIYARVSTAEQSVERQLDELRAWAQRNAWPVTVELTETGSGAKTDRAQRAKLMDLARRGKVKTILVLELTRWSRSTVDLISTLETLSGYGCSVRALNGFDLDVTTPHGRMLAGVFGALAEFERDLLRERIVSGIAAAQRRGVHCGRKHGSLSAHSQRALAYIRAHPHALICDIVRTCNVSRNTATKLRNSI